MAELSTSLLRVQSISCEALNIDTDSPYQAEVAFNRLLPYADELNREADKLLADIKANFGRCVMLRDINPGCRYWAHMLRRYVRLYGLRFTKEEHAALVKLAYELVAIPELQSDLLHAFGSLVVILLCNDKFLSTDDLELPWEPLYKQCHLIVFRGMKTHTLPRYSKSDETLLKTVAFDAKKYFPLTATREILDELKPYVYLLSDFPTLQIFQLLISFLPSKLPPEHYAIGHELWLAEFMKLWEVYHNNKWECTFMYQVADLAWKNIGRIDWKPYVPLMFTRIFRWLHLPVHYRNYKYNNSWFVTNQIPDAKWIASVLGDKTKAQDYLDKLLSSIETYLHPTNCGGWTQTLENLILKIIYHVVIRVNKERYSDDKDDIPESHKLTDANIDAFVNSVLPVVITGVCSDKINKNLRYALQYLTNLRPNLVIPRILERLYPVVGAPVEAHKMVTFMSCFITIAKNLTQGSRCANKDYAFAEGPKYVIPLLFSSLDGVDPNDMNKCISALALIITYVNLVPVVDCSKTAIKPDDEIDRIVCAETARFEDFVLKLMDKLFAIIETSKIEFIRLDNMSDIHFKSDHEKTFQSSVFKCFMTLMFQASRTIFASALMKFRSYALSNDLETKVAGQSAGAMCSIFSYTDGKLTLDCLFPNLADRILESLKEKSSLEEENLDNQLIFPMLLMQNLMSAQGDALLPYIDKIIRVLDVTTKLKSKEGYNCAFDILTFTLRSLCSSKAVRVDRDLDDPDYPYWEDWGKDVDLKEARVIWYIPGEEEYAAATRLFHRYFVPAVDSIKNMVEAKSISMSRERMLKTLKLISSLVSGCKTVLPIWSEDPIASAKFESCCNYTFKPISEIKHAIEMPDGSNVCKFLVPILTGLQDLLLQTREDDTESLLNLAQLYYSTSFNTSIYASKEGYKIFESGKIVFQDYLTGSKGFLPCTFLQRIILQIGLRQELAVHTFTETSRVILCNLFKLGISRYSKVRATAQTYFKCILDSYPNAYEVMIPWILEALQKDTEAEHEAYKGVLYMLQSNQHILFNNNNGWSLMSKVLPAFVLAKPSSKESITHLQDTITRDSCNHFLSTNFSLDIPNNCIEAASELWKLGIQPSREEPSESEIQVGIDSLKQATNTSLDLYYDTLNKLMEAIENGSLHWRHRQMASTFISFLIQPNYVVPKSVVTYFVNALNNETIEERRKAWLMMIHILKLQKRKQKKIPIDIPVQEATVNPGPRPDNAWLQYHSDKLPLTAEQWDEPCYVHDVHTGYYAWPKKLEVYAPSTEQPNLEPSRPLNEQEQEIDRFFRDEQNVAKLINYLTLEENKGQEKINKSRHLMFQNLFRNHGDAYLEIFLKHLTEMVKSQVDCVQRAAAEIIAGIIRGSKHWPFDATQNMWKRLLPIIKQVLNNITQETISIWSRGLSYAVGNRDPRQLHWLLECLIEEWQNFHSKSTFSERVRLLMLRTVINNQSWRLVEFWQRLLPKFVDNLLQNPLVNVRDQLVLGMVSAFNIRSEFEGDERSEHPLLIDFVNKVLDRLKTLSLSMENKKSPEYEDFKRLLHTTCLWMINTMKFSHFGTLSIFYQLYPIICQMENEDPEVDISSICKSCTAALAKAFVLPRHVPTILQTIDEMSKGTSKSMRACSIQFLQVLIFHNMSLFMSNEEWLETVTSIVLRLMRDETVEVRLSSTVVLDGLLHCTLIKDHQSLLDEFRQLAKMTLNAKKFKSADGAVAVGLGLRHAGVLGMCSFIQAHPYDIPEHVPPIFEYLIAHLNDPEPISSTIRQTFNNFKRTHCDSWTGLQGLTQYLTEEQLDLLQDLDLFEPYYA